MGYNGDLFWDKGYVLYIYILYIYVCIYIYIRSDQLHLDLDQRTRGFDQEAGSLTNSDQ